MSEEPSVTPRCPGAGDVLPVELTQMILWNLDEQELFRITREVDDLTDHAIEVTKVKFLAVNNLTISDAASVAAYHKDMLGPNYISTNGNRFPLEIPIIRDSDLIAGIIRGNELRIMETLIDAGLEATSYSKSGWTLLGLALACGASDDMAARLIDTMETPHLIDFARLGKSAPSHLTLAAYCGKDHFRRMWLRVRHLENSTAHVLPVAIFQLCRHADAAFADGLLADGIDLSMAELPEKGHTAWHAAAEANDNLDFFEWLDRRIPEHINKRSLLGGYTPLMTAAAEMWHNREEAIKWLLVHGADPALVAQNNKTAVSMAEAYNNPHLIPLFEKKKYMEMQATLQPYSSDSTLGELDEAVGAKDLEQ